MGASLSLSLSESDVNISANTSKVKATLKITATGETWNGYSRSGSITIDGTKYSFSSSFGKGKTTTLATKSKTITHNADGKKTVTVKGYYSTGVSPGNLSISKKITLTAIPRNHTVYYNANGGYPTPGAQTKTYGYGLLLSNIVPTREGYSFLYWSGYGGNYYPSSYYYYDNNTTMTAVWSEHTETIVYIDNKHENFSQEARYSTEYKIASPEVFLSGYTFEGWSLNPDGSGTLYQPNQSIKAAYIEPSSIDTKTFYAVWKAKSYFVSYNLNAPEGEASWIDNPNLKPKYNLAIYDTEYSTPPYDGVLTREGFSFQGWATTPNGQITLQPNYSFIWNRDHNLELYAVWSSILVPVNYYRVKEFESTNMVDSSYFSNIDNYNIIYSEQGEGHQPVKYHSYTLKDLGSDNPPDLAQYTFTGCWVLNKPTTRVYTEYGQTFPAAIIPYDYKLNFDEYNYDSVDGFYKPGYIFQNVDNTLKFYPVYRDNTPSIITHRYNAYEYTAQRTTQKSYYLYLSKQIDYYDSDLYNDYVTVGFIYRSSIPTVTLDYSEAKIILTSLKDPSIEIELNPIFARSILDNNYTTYYLICKNKDDVDDPHPLLDSSTESYRMEISGLKDVFGKSVTGTSINIIPPKPIRDINFEGNAVSLFLPSNDYTEYEKENHHTKNEFTVNGISLAYNWLFYNNDEEDSFSNYLKANLPESEYDWKYDSPLPDDPEGTVVFEYPDLIKILKILITKIKYLESKIPDE